MKTKTLYIECFEKDFELIDQGVKSSIEIGEGSVFPLLEKGYNQKEVFDIVQVKNFGNSSGSCLSVSSFPSLIILFGGFEYKNDVWYIHLGTILKRFTLYS